MKPTFTQEGIQKKHETNVKSAVSGYGLAGILGIVYIVRFFITKNFDFYFSLTFTELMLRLGEGGKMPLALSYAFVALFVLLYLFVLALASKKAENLRIALGMYLFDSICFVPLFIFHGTVEAEFFIDVIVHLFVVVFIIVGIKSSRYVK